jgi:CheY-like chemotaxis protein
MPARSRPGSARSPREDRTTPSPLILIAEDNYDQQALYASYFLAKGFRVQTARDGESAFDRAVASVPDVIVMDLSMPRVDGWEVTRRLKVDLRTKRIPVIACTAHAFGPAVERALIAGCIAYVVKPCLPEDLFREVLRILAQTETQRRRRA